MCTYYDGMLLLLARPSPIKCMDSKNTRMERSDMRLLESISNDAAIATTRFSSEFIRKRNGRLLHLSKKVFNQKGKDSGREESGNNEECSEEGLTGDQHCSLIPVRLISWTKQKMEFFILHHHFQHMLILSSMQHCCCSSTHAWI